MRDSKQDSTLDDAAWFRRATKICRFIESRYLAWDDFSRCGHAWTGLRQVADQARLDLWDPRWPPALTTRLALAAMLASDASSAQTLIRRVWERLPELHDDDERCLALALLSDCHQWQRPAVRVDALECVIRAAEFGDNLPKAKRAWWHLKVASFHAHHGDAESAGQGITRAEELATAGGHPATTRAIVHVRAELEIRQGRLHSARARIDQAWWHLTRGTNVDVVQYHALEALWHLGAADYGGARRHVDSATALLDRLAIPAVQAARVYAIAAMICIGAGHYKQADEWWQRTLIVTDGAPHCEAQRQLSHASAAIVTGQDGAELDRYLRAGLDCPQLRPLKHLAGYLPQVCAKLVDAALTRGLRNERLARSIAELKLTGPNPSSPHWPWHTAIFTLGSWSLFHRGDLSQFLSLSKPTELLALLLAEGSAGIDRALAAHLLWPIPSMADAQRALQVTLHRLRKLLGHPDAILAGPTSLSINHQIVWSDARALECLCGAARQSLSSGLNAGELKKLSHRFLSLCNGPFLPGVHLASVKVYRASLAHLAASSARDLVRALRDFDASLADRLSHALAGLDANECVELP